MAEKNKGINKGYNNLKPCKPGETHNPNGRPLGQKNYSTLYKEALTKLAKSNNMIPDDFERDILSRALLNARAGDYRFYKDVMDRLHGKASEKVDITTNGESLNTDTTGIDIEALAKKMASELKKKKI